MDITKLRFEDLQMINKAIEFAMKKHKDQKDDCGRCYFEAHLMQVFQIIEVISADYVLLCASVLHDTIEDTETTYEELCDVFNSEIADLVMEVTHEGQKDSYGFYFPRLRTQRGIILKFADRISNLSRMDSWDKGRIKQYLKRSKFWKDGSTNG